MLLLLLLFLLQHGTLATAYQPTNVDIPVMNPVVRSDWLNVLSVGAVGDGEHDDTTAIQRAFRMLANSTENLTAAKTGQHLSIYFPPGAYVISRTLEFGSNKTELLPGGLEWITLVGHGASSRLLWTGSLNGSMLWSNGCTRCRLEGLKFDGNQRAGVGIDHRSFSRYESRFLHINLAFDGFIVAGIRAGLKPYGTPSAEMLYQNCLFANSTTGLQLLAFNQYDNALEGCHFVNCAIGLDDEIGNFYLRDSRFERSTVADIVASAHSNSIRRVVSQGSAAFVVVRSSSASSELKISDCRIHGWTKPGGAAVAFGARGPLQVIDTTFTGGPAGATAAITLSEEATSVVLSGAVSEGLPMISGPNSSEIITLPPSARTTGPNKAVTIDTHFLKEQWPLPTLVLDAVLDYNAVGNNIADDTLALQTLVNAAVAAAAGKAAGAVAAYIPAGRFLITRPLHIQAGLHLDGSGYGSQIVMAPHFVGEAGVVVSDGVDGRVTQLTNLAVDNTLSGMNTTQPLLVKGGCGAVFVNNVHVDADSYGCNEAPNVTGHGHARGCQALGLLLDGLTSSDIFHANVLDGRLVVSDSSEAVVLVGFHVQGGTAVLAPGGAIEQSPTTGNTDREGVGFVGELFRAESFNRFDLQVNDSQSYVISDFYTEQTWQYMLLAGNPTDSAGRVTVGGVKIGTNMYRYDGDDDLMPVIQVEGYHGQLVHFGGHFQYANFELEGPAKQPPYTLQQTGDAEFHALFFGDTWLWQAPLWSVRGLDASVCTLNNIITMMPVKNLTVPNQCVGSSANARAPSVQLIGAGWDHMRELGDWDLKLNYPAVVDARMNG